MPPRGGRQMKKNLPLLSGRLQIYVKKLNEEKNYL
jgi:hypothetical protein